ncbi:MAG TPA: aspartate aminotransferase [Bacteroidales bacterium]|nr:aspartate aminotransferase [Bacteroidales bacterium]
MKKLSTRIENMAQSETLMMAQKSRELKAKGIDVINMSIGEPDFNTPDHVKQAAKDAIDNNYSFYSPVPGFLDLREAIVKKFQRENNLQFQPNQIVVSNGAKQSLANVFMCIINKGDEVIIPAPYWVSYKEIVKLAEGVPVFVQSSVETNFKVTAEQISQAITPRTKAFLFSSPSNPSGSIYSKEELKAIADVFQNHEDIIIVSDEIYEHINFVGKHESIAQFDSIKDRVVLVNGVSKGYAMTGWRIGYIAAPQWIASACEKFQGQFTSGASSIAQKASVVALCSDSDFTKNMAAIFEGRRNLIIKLVKDIKGIKYNIPEGAFYLLPDVSYFFGKTHEKYFIKNSSDLAMYILEQANVAVVTGDAFGVPECIRISYATSEELIEKALIRIKEALSKLK